MRLSTSMLRASAVEAILQAQNALAKTQTELATGKRINTPADDPVAATQLLALNNLKAQQAQYTANGQSAKAVLGLESQALSDTTNTLQSIRDLIVQANSGTNRPSDLSAIATQIQGLEQQLQGIANRKDTQGSYLFSGYSQSTQPFARGAGGSMTYAGDAGTSRIQLDSGASIQVRDPGSTIFMDIPAGNGTFTTATAPTNVGSGSVDTGGVTDAAAWVPGQYTITFTTATTWAVTDAGGLPVADAAGNPVVGTYDPGAGTSQISFNGIEVGISGAPAANDTFTVSAAGTEDVFTTLDKLVSTLSNAGSGSASMAKVSSALGGSLQQIDQALNRTSAASTAVGSRINLIGTIGGSVADASASVTTQISTLQDANYVDATTRYSQQYLALQAAEQSFAQFSQLSLFKYL